MSDNYDRPEFPMGEFPTGREYSEPRDEYYDWLMEPYQRRAEAEGEAAAIDAAEADAERMWQEWHESYRTTRTFHSDTLGAVTIPDNE